VAIEALGLLRCERAIGVLEVFCEEPRQARGDADSQARYYEARQAIRQIRTGVRVP